MKVLLHKTSLFSFVLACLCFTGTAVSSTVT